jgi:predicted glycoside hydrolase/deacetylase ChbG (UPF0249 family)
MRRLWLIADDYGLSPGVDDAILNLLKLGRLSGTGCMTVFPQWESSARRMQEECPASGAIGLHLTLTDQPALSGRSPLAPQGRLPTHARLLKAVTLGGVTGEHVAAELDAQLARFEEALGRQPDFIDGHQHVHVLKPVREWLARRHSHFTKAPWLRGTPAPKLTAPKPTVVRLLAVGFTGAMQRAGYEVRGPLAGFYDWRRTDAFLPMLEEQVPGLQDGAVMMCHPGHVDDVLRARDMLTEARETEYRELGSDGFGRLLADNRISLAHREP